MQRSSPVYQGQGVKGMRLRVTVALVGILVMLLPAAAQAEVGWVRRGTDPSDIGCLAIGGDPCLGFDVRTSILRIVRDHGRSFLTVTLRTDMPVREGWKSGVALDTRGGKGTDHRAFLSNPIGSQMPLSSRCGVRGSRPHSALREGVYRIRRQGTIATCRFPLRWFAPLRLPIRWRVATDWSFPEPAPLFDRAPDRGWYP